MFEKLGFVFILVFLVTLLLIKVLMNVLPKDKGKEFAVDGIVSKGKPRGAGLIFISSFAIFTVLYTKFDIVSLIYVILAMLSMLTGYLDDISKADWGRLRKGLLDLAISLVSAYTLVYVEQVGTNFDILGWIVTVPAIALFLASAFLVWISINVTNCSDGVDGLSGNLSIVTLMSVFIFIGGANSSYMLIILVASILAYLMFNTSPSTLIMGDAGSRPIGLLIAVFFIQADIIYLYPLFAFVIMFNGGTGLAKISIIKVFKKNLLSFVRTPLHDHARSKYKWSDSQVVFKFTVIQIVISILTISIFKG